MSRAVAVFIAYVERSLKVRRRQRDRPSEEVLRGAREVIERLYAMEER